MLSVVKCDVGAKWRPTVHHRSIVKRNPSLPINNKPARRGRMSALFLPHSLGKQPTCVSLSQFARQPPVQGAVTPASDFSFRTFAGIMAHRGQNSSVTGPVLSLATAGAVWDISQSFGSWREFILGGFFFFQVLLFGVNVIYSLSNTVFGISSSLRL